MTDPHVDPAEFDKLWHIVIGNGDKGLIHHVNEIRSDLYKNEEKGTKGLVADVRHIKDMMTSASGWVKGAAAALALFGVTGTAAAVKSLFGL